MGATYFTSDLHFGHQKVSEIRGFDNTDDHDITLYKRWNEVVKPQDTVYVLGDLTCDQRKEDYALSMMHWLNGTHHLIAGNHDSVSSIHRNGWKHLPKYLKVFASVRDFAKIRMRKQDILMSHYPYSTSVEADHGRVRYEEYRLPDMGHPLIHGHTHLAHQRLHRSTEGSRQVHVGLDAWDLRPVHHSVVEGLIFGE